MNVAIKDWQTAGLLKPSVARPDHVVTAEKSIFLRRLGVLSPEDQMMELFAIADIRLKSAGWKHGAWASGRLRGS